MGNLNDGVGHNLSLMLLMGHIRLHTRKLKAKNTILNNDKICACLFLFNQFTQGSNSRQGGQILHDTLFSMGGHSKTSMSSSMMLAKMNFSKTIKH